MGKKVLKWEKVTDEVRDISHVASTKRHSFEIFYDKPLGYGLLWNNSVFHWFRTLKGAKTVAEMIVYN